LIAATALYISAKSEETSTQAPAYKVVNEMKKIGKKKVRMIFFDFFCKILDFHMQQKMF
jgi:hypothetical protein